MEVSRRAAAIIASLFEKATGQQLSEDRHWRIGTTLAPFCRVRGIDSFDQLAAMLERSVDPDLSIDMIDTLLNRETSFFRDSNIFMQIEQHILPELAAARQEVKRLRLWSAACSDGQEAYSLAMLIAEQPALWDGWKIEIVRSDISRSAINRARLALYTQFEVQRGLPIRRLAAWFDPVLDRGWRAKHELTSLVTFTRHNLLGPQLAGGRFDRILCRNALLYFSPGRRNQMLEGLSLALASDGALLLGAGETALGHSNRFINDPDMPMVYRSAAFPRLSDAA